MTPATAGVSMNLQYDTEVIIRCLFAWLHEMPLLFVVVQRRYQKKELFSFPIYMGHKILTANVKRSVSKQESITIEASHWRGRKGGRNMNLTTVILT